MPLKLINIKDLKLGRTYGKEAGEAAFGGDMFSVTSVSFKAYLCVVCLVLHLSIRCVSADMQCFVKGCVFRDHGSCVFCLWVIQRDLGAGKPGNEVKGPFLAGPDRGH